MKKATFAGILACGFLLVSFAGLAQAEPQWNFLVKATRDHQELNGDSSDLDTLTLQPSMQTGNWSFTATLPWQRLNGTTYFDNQHPKLAKYVDNICTYIQQLQPGTRLNAIESQYPRLTSYCINNYSSSQSTSETGWGDATLFANYVFPVDWQHVNTSLGVGYKDDNGDMNTGLGTGTKDIYAENAWLLGVNKLSFLLTLGYNHIVKDNTGLDLKDHAYYTLDSRWQFTDIVAAGVEYDYQQSNSDLLDNYDYYTAYVSLGRPKGWGGRLFYIDYHGQDGLPDREYGGSLSYFF